MTRRDNNGAFAVLTIGIMIVLAIMYGCDLKGARDHFTTEQEGQECPTPTLT